MVEVITALKAQEQLAKTEKTKVTKSRKMETAITDNKENQQQGKTLFQLKADVLHKVKDMVLNVEFETPEEEAEFARRLQQKMESGKKLTTKEMNYLKKTNPVLYQHMLRVQHEREALKNRLKRCKTKQEAQRVISQAYAAVSKKDPVRQQMLAAISDVARQFTNSSRYQKLPENAEELKKRKNQKVDESEDPFPEDKEAEEEGDGEVSISYEGGLGSYQSAAVTDSTSTAVFSSEA